MDDSFFRGLDDSIRAARNSREARVRQLKTEPCMDLPEVGDHVLIDAEVVGKGWSAKPLEAKVLRVADTAYEVEYLTYKAYGSDQPHVEWVQAYVVQSVLPQQ